MRIVDPSVAIIDRGPRPRAYAHHQGKHRASARGSRRTSATTPRSTASRKRPPRSRRGCGRRQRSSGRAAARSAAERSSAGYFGPVRIARAVRRARGRSTNLLASSFTKGYGRGRLMSAWHVGFVSQNRPQEPKLPEPVRPWALGRLRYVHVNRGRDGLAPALPLEALQLGDHRVQLSVHGALIPQDRFTRGVL